MIMIPIAKEPKEYYQDWHCYEKCIFCDNDTDTWYEKKNIPVCETCAKKHTVKEAIKINERLTEELNRRLIAMRHSKLTK